MVKIGAELRSYPIFGPPCSSCSAFDMHRSYGDVFLVLFYNFRVNFYYASTFLSHTGWPNKTGTLGFVRFNFVKYWPIFKLFFTFRIRRTFVIVLSLEIPPRLVCRYTTLWYVRVLKATIENKTTSVTIRLRVHRPVASRTNRTFDVKTTGATVTIRQ